MVKYIYDGWGNHAIVAENGEDIESGIGVLNPFRYRGYYYDTETELYFLQTRYYDPEVGRFISRDSIEYADPVTINGLNLYTYCGNDPVMGYDPEGTWNWLKALAVVVVAALVVVAIVATAGAAAIPATTTGAALATTALDLTAAAAGGAAFSGVLSISSQSDEEFSIKQFGIDLAVGAVSGMFSYGTGKVLGYMGESFGIALSNSSFMSFPIKNVFSGEFMGKAGQFWGGFTGGLFGGMFIDKHVAKLCGMPSSLLERLGSNIGGDVFSRIISLFGGILR